MYKVSLYPRFLAQYGEDRLSEVLAEAQNDMDKLDLRCGLPKDYIHVSVINRLTRDEVVAESMLKSYSCTVSGIAEDMIERLKDHLLPTHDKRGGATREDATSSAREPPPKQK